MVEQVFDTKFEAADDAAVVAVIADCARAEAVLAARRLAATAELTARYTEPDGQREHLAVDGWRMASAEVSAAMGIGDRGASREMCIAMALRERLPHVAALFAEGRLSAGLVATITWRTQLIVDSEILAKVDTAIADRAAKWGSLSVAKLESAIDSLVDEHDPDARRRLREAARSRDVQFGKRDDVTGTTSLWGRLSAADAELLERRLAQMSSELCKDDPRTAGQRRSDSLGAMAAHAERLTCQCGSPECPSGGDDPRATNFVINVITGPAALTAQPDPQMSGDDQMQPTEPAAQPAQPPAEPAAAAAERAQPRAEPAAAAAGGAPSNCAAVILGGALIPASLLAELINNGATVRWVHTPDAAPEPGYRPSQKTARFVRMRDMTCRFPGCARPAQYCDIDHTVPYPAGATHPSNTKCLCRIHHLLKTFGGWRDEQHSDGSVHWTAPSGRTYVTHPGSRLFFPGWDTCTPALPATPRPTENGDKGAMMPRRRRTRTQDRLRRIERERALNALDRHQPPAPITTEPERPPPDDLWNIDISTGTNCSDADPPPF
ncbi:MULTISPECIES: HNH endonuclease signature motif containing protein [unclassified Mycobacterium]|uniref:HNH endonuclease signature motif containing protein n=1 Tax=unclassified Mycobacterium TaxID=2642494 RepID=UPI00155F9637|nr:MULTISPECIES: HNH endonuclease signature motif containing protein [unclassified Mycobacterium]